VAKSQVAPGPNQIHARAISMVADMSAISIWRDRRHRQSAGFSGPTGLFCRCGRQYCPDGKGWRNDVLSLCVLKQNPAKLRNGGGAARAKLVDDD
jgi:hypothetical protein